MKRLIFVTFLITIFCAATSKAQEVRIIEKLPSGEYVVSIDGVEHKAITAAHAREAAARKLELDRITRERDLLSQQNDLLKREIILLKRDRDLSDSMALLERKRADSFELLYKGERELRIAAEKLGHRGRLSSFFEHPAVQIGLKIAWPAVQTWLAGRR